MNEGYIPISRRLFSHPFWEEKRVFSRLEAWLDIIQSAQYQDGGVLVKGKYITLKRGQTQGALRYWQSRWCWGSPDKVKRFFLILQEQDMIRVENKTVTQRITICKYDDYNGQHDTTTTTTRQTHDRRTTDARQIQISNKENKENKGSVPPQGKDFDLLKRIGKDAARMWTEGNLSETLNGKSELALEWLEHLAQMGKPYRSHAQIASLVKNFKKFTPERLRAMMDYSIPAGYPNLYPDFDKDKTGITTGGKKYPADWSPGIEERLRLSPQETIEYYKSLIAAGWKKETYQGKTHWKKNG